MKFEQLFNSIYTPSPSDTNIVSEEAGKNTVAVPEDFDDVEPLPVPETNVSSEDNQQPNSSSSATAPTASTLKDYVFQLEDFAEKLNGMEGNSLQSLVSSLDRPGTPFDGISSRTKSEIVRVSETLLSISEKLKSFIINAIRK
jgi:hypothetical protein